MTSHAARVREWASYYRSLGYQPVPSRDKRPLVRHASHWERGFESDPFAWAAAPAIQVMTGQHWRLCAIDLDGPQAIDRWRSLGECPVTWTVISPGGGQHLWFRLPAWREPRSHALLWGSWDQAANGGRGEWRRRTAIELLAERSLLTAPPSRHPTGGLYRFASGLGPPEVPRPAVVPGWVWRLPALERPQAAPQAIRTDATPPRPRPDARCLRYADLVALIPGPEKITLAKAWGLRFATKPRQVNGWVDVHDFDREDRRPSARFDVHTGNFWRPGQRRIRFLDLAVELGAYSTWIDASRDVYKRYA